MLNQQKEQQEDNFSKKVVEFKMKKLIIKTMIGLCMLSAQADLGSPNNVLVIQGDFEGRSSAMQFFKNGAFEGKTDFKETETRLKQGYSWIFMGDGPDRGAFDGHQLRITEQAAIETPDRFAELAGNRDINKLRFGFELTNEALSKPPREVGGGQFGSDWTKFDQWAAEKYPQRNLESLRTSRSARLEYLQHKTMGAPEAYQWRITRLALESGFDHRSLVTAEQYHQSHIGEARPGGDVFKKLERSQLITLDAQRGTVFVHGALTDSMIVTESDGKLKGVYPVERNGELVYEKAANIFEMAEKTNEFLKQQLAKAAQGSYPKALIQYQEPKLGTRAHAQSVVYGRFSNADGMIDMENTKKVETFLRQSGFHTVISAHTPMGETGVISSNRQGTFRIAAIDTSYGSANTHPVVAVTEQGKTISIKAPVPAAFNAPTGSTFIATHTIGEPTQIGQMTRRGFLRAGVVIGPQGQKHFLDFKIGTVDGKPFQHIIERSNYNGSGVLSDHVSKAREMFRTYFNGEIGARILTRISERLGGRVRAATTPGVESAKRAGRR